MSVEPTAPVSARHAVLDPIVAANPITVQVLGLCSALAVTSSLLPALIMSAAVVAVLVFANVAVSLLRRGMPHSIRLIVEVTLISSAVIVVDEVLKTFAPEVSSVLSVFVGLIITNCIILGRVEAFAMHHRVWDSFLDALGNGLGYSWVLVTVASIRELLGAGTLLGHPVLVSEADGGRFVPNELMLLTPSAFFIIGLMIWAARSLSLHRSRNPDATPGRSQGSEFS